MIWWYDQYAVLKASHLEHHQSAKLQSWTTGTSKRLWCLIATWVTGPFNYEVLEPVADSLGGINGLSEVTTVDVCFTGSTDIVKVLANSMAPSLAKRCDHFSSRALVSSLNELLVLFFLLAYCGCGV